MDYVTGDSDWRTCTIRLLNVSDRIKYTSHKNSNVEEVKGTLLHEIVHQCHHIFHNDYRRITWFLEGLATNLSNQKYEICSLDDCDFDMLRSDFRHYSNAYQFSYTLVNYILNNYSDDEIERLCKDPDYLRKCAEKIFDEAKQWVNSINC